jgi:hypothetical protein
MTRSASPNGKVEFSYDFPVASTSQLPPRTTKTRTRSPTRPRWESTNYYLADDDDEVFYPHDDEYDVDAFPTATRKRRAHTHPAPTGNQWTQRAPSPPLYPYGSDALYPTAYPYTAPLLLAPPPARSCDSACSMLSACSAQSASKQSTKEKKTLRKPRRSVDSDAPPSAFLAPTSSPNTSGSSTSPASSPASSPYFSTYGDDFDDESASHDSHHSVFEDDVEGADHDAEDAGAEEPHGPAPSAFRRQWAALSLRVRFGVFRAKRRMRTRVMSL